MALIYSDLLIQRACPINTAEKKGNNIRGENCLFKGWRVDEVAAPSVIAQIAYVVRWEEMLFFHGSIAELDIISPVVAIIRKLERAGKKKTAEGLVWMKYEIKHWSTAVTLRLSRLSREDIRQLFRLEQIRFARCIQSSSYRRLKEVDQLISCNNTFKIWPCLVWASGLLVFGHGWGQLVF